MNNGKSFILILFGLLFLWSGLVGNLGAVLSSIFQPQLLTDKV